MKKLITITVSILVAGSLLFPHRASAQAPEKLSYQAVIRDAEGNLVTGVNVGMKISILQGSVEGTVVYSETQIPATNANGLITAEIGGEDATVKSGVFAEIDWSAGPYFMKTETDPSGGTEYSITNISQLLSVPFSLHAKTAETLSEAIVETDPLFNASDAAGIEAGNIENWNTAYSERLNWDGGNAGLNATDGRTSLGLGSLAVLNQVPDESIDAQQLADNSVNRDAAAPDITDYLVPVGTIVMWSGAIEEIPAGWRLCDGTEGTPDLRGRFIVGYDSEDADYNVIGAQGGAKSHTLALSQLPEHNHIATASSAGEHTHLVSLTTSSGGIHSHAATTSLSGMTKPMRLGTISYRSGTPAKGDHTYAGLGNNSAYIYNPSASTTISSAGSHTHAISGNTGSASDHTHTVNIDNTGGGEAFDKRPPYFVLAYIMKIEN